MFFEQGLKCRVDKDSTSYWFFKGSKILIFNDKVHFTSPEIDLDKFSEKLIRSQCLDRVEGHSYYVAELSADSVAPEGMSFCELRQLLGQLPDDLFFQAGKAYQMLHWDRTHQYCSQCASKMENKIDERAKFCPSCGFINYPRISPAIIVAITRGRELLLARGSRFPTAFYSVLAGFVEPGESFEECVQREVEEEVGLKVKNIQYFGSQPWPFPDSLMVGFTAEYASGDIIIDNKEILEAGWFTAEQLPQVPGIGSIARRLINWFVEMNKSR